MIMYMENTINVYYVASGPKQGGLCQTLFTTEKIGPNNQPTNLPSLNLFFF